MENDDVDGLAKAMQYLIEHPEKMEEYGEYAHKFAKTELNWDRIVGKIYEEIEERKIQN